LPRQPPKHWHATAFDVCFSLPIGPCVNRHASTRAWSNERSGKWCALSLKKEASSYRDFTKTSWIYEPVLAEFPFLPDDRHMLSNHSANIQMNSHLATGRRLAKRVSRRMFEIKIFSLTNKTIVDVRKISEHGLGVSGARSGPGFPGREVRPSGKRRY
jgi:hypothetical protein